MAESRPTKSPRKMTDAELEVSYSIPTADTMRKRSASLVDLAKINGIEGIRFCLKSNYCNLLSCPWCRRREQLVQMVEMPSRMSEVSEDDILTSITIIPEFGVTEVGELPKGGLRGFKESIRSAVKKVAPEAQGTFFIDVSLEKGLDQETVFQWHVHGVVTKFPVNAQKKLSKRFKRNGSKKCYRPVRTETVHDIFGWIAYSAKSDLFRREQYIDLFGKTRHDPTKMSVQEELDVLRAVSKIKVKQRQFNIGM